MFSQDKVQAVIARYREDLSWAGELQCRATIYNKGEPPVEGAVVLPNIGRESHSYLTHIINNYSVLPEFTVFLQGSPFFHMEEGADCAVLNALILENVSRNVPFKGFAWFRMVCDQLGRPHQLCDPEKEGRWLGWGKDIPVGEVYEYLFNRPAPRKFIASAATGLFMVRRDRILIRPVEFYEKALSLIESDPHDANNTGHAFERLWQVIFNGSAAINPTNL
ncbi:DUF3431 domain-containing protein [Maridesulfovibrio hydrothermalis]|uniref:DUF3431 domain-containing protein n=1 Tax=Maridesulfovibrio hydrothermalis AM13 = DSM 14728 TaxID=1121451 RepID=L0RA10_9BACT|nr:DUF3431 domain-containing protein [Maridesulfovibrio hydrothermalis]CCO23052.1 conserved protein of unknown function [Maridesulfovibrio hydrothermalis AM13 = DSM 14728]